MQTAKPTLYFKHGQYEVEIEPQGERKLALTVTDTASRSEYYAPDILLDCIGTNTLVKALQRTKQEISIAFKERLIEDKSHLEVKIAVESAFLKPVEEYILLKKNRQVSEAEAVKKAIDHLSKQIREIKNSSDKNKTQTFYGAVLDQKSYTSGNYEPLVSLKLPKGKYLITFNFLVRASSQWMYIYFGQGGMVMSNSGFYVPSSSNFIPQTVRKVHTVVQQVDTISFTTYCASSYPITLRNAIVTAKAIE